MAGSVADYTQSMLALLPNGAAWPREPESEWAKLFEGIAEEFARADAINQQLLNETLPSKTSSLLTEWENDYGLPTDCTKNIAQTFAQRRTSLVSKYKLVGNQSRQFFIDTAAEFGFAITITEYSASNPGAQSDYNGLPINGDDWNFCWQINAPLTTLTRRVSGSLMGEPFTVFGNELLECVMNEIKHAHRILFFSYT